MRIEAKEGFVVDEEGNRIGVIIDLEEYKKLLSDLEELECIRAYDDAKSSSDEVLDLENAL